MQGVLWLADGGALRCRTPHSLHVLPPTLALWVARELPHEVQALGGARLLRVELALADDGAEGQAPATCRVALAGSLLTELARTLADEACAPPDASREQMLRALARAELQGARRMPVGIALPRSPVLRRACEAALKDGAVDCDLQALARAAHTSVRTLARRFQQELDLPFSQWRAQVRLARMVTLWAEGHTLSASAAQVGYTSASALTFMVRRMLGVTPSRLLSG